MDILLVVFFVLGVCCPQISYQQRVAPGVPPQHYDPNLHQQGGYMQQPPPPQYQQQQQIPQQYQQQQQQVPVQHQQVPQGQVPQQHNQVPHGHGGVPVQQQQVPIQQQQQHVPVQQQHPGQAGHGAHAHGGGHFGSQPLLDTSQIVQERAHIQEHMDLPIDTSQMSEQELQFHYFKMHDADNNNKLDGCELVKSLIHWHDQSNHDERSGQPIPEAKIFKDDELIQMIDPILENDDKNRDGFIDYAEFVQAQATAAAKATPTHTA